MKTSYGGEYFNYSVNGAAGIENHSTASFPVAFLLLKSTLNSIHSSTLQILNKPETTKTRRVRFYKS